MINMDLIEYVYPCHQCIMHPSVVEGEDSFQIWKVAMNILNKQPFCLGVKDYIVIKVTHGLGIGRILWNDNLGKGKWI
jgi:hypothetical protein